MSLALRKPHICSAYSAASRVPVRGRSTASASGPPTSAAVVTAGGTFSFLRASGTANAATSAAAPPPGRPAPTRTSVARRALQGIAARRGEYMNPSDGL